MVVIIGHGMFFRYLLGNGHPFFKWIKQEAGFLAFPKWNFYKYLINNKGELVSWYTSTTNPKADKIQKELQKLINEK